MAQQSKIVCIGNAIVDVLGEVNDQFLIDHDRVKGSMMLVDEATSARLYGAMPPSIEQSGGSVANTAAGIANLGGDVRFIGKVKDDQLGRVFQHDIRSSGVAFDVPPAPTGEATSTSLIMVTPDGQRTMNTYLGAAGSLGRADIIDDHIRSADLVFIEGYLFDRPEATAAIDHILGLVRGTDTKTALTLCDSFCVERHLDRFRDMAENHVDILFANADEIKALHRADDVTTAMERHRRYLGVAAITLSEKGSVILTKATDYQIAAQKTTIKDTTGAGDLYAAGFLFGFASGLDYEKCGRLGSLCAAEIISHIGARPQKNLADLVAPVVNG